MITRNNLHLFITIIVIITDNLADSNPINHKSRVIHAKIGDYINITCNLQSLNIPKKFFKKRSLETNNEQFEISFSNSNYDIDWYFIDRSGKNNIISYGNNIPHSKSHKYKIYVGSVNDDLLTFENPLPSKSQLRSLNNQHDSVIYLNTLIESEDDEGLYQCIDPNLTDFNIQNVAVRVRNQSCVFGNSIILNLILVIFYLVIFTVI